MKFPVDILSVSKRYDGVTALDEISLRVADGKLFGLIGPDGAGKTTLFRLMTGLLLPDKGSMSILGNDPVQEYKAIRSRVGYMPGRFSLYPDLSVQENIEFFARIFGTTVEENYELIKPIFGQLEPFRDRLADNLSGGMKQKLALSCALVHQPELLFLDEPTTGVDAVSRKEFWQMLKQLQDRGLTIIVSTPYMDEAEKCDRVALIQNGRILQVDKPEAVTRSYKKPLLAIKAADRYRLLQKLRNYRWADSVQPFGEYLHYADSRSETNPDEIREYLSVEGFSEVEVKRVEPHIEDRFIDLMTGTGNE